MLSFHSKELKFKLQVHETQAQSPVHVSSIYPPNDAKYSVKL